MFAQLYQYAKEGVLSSVDVNFDYSNPTEPYYITFDSSKPLYVEGILEINYFNSTLPKYDLAEFTTGVHPPCPRIVNPAEGYPNFRIYF